MTIYSKNVLKIITKAFAQCVVLAGIERKITSTVIYMNKYTHILKYIKICEVYI